MPLDFQAYPRIDRETLERKVRAVIGEERFKREDNLTDREWEDVFSLCIHEYNVRGILIVSARTMHRLEAMSADRATTAIQQAKFKRDRLRRIDEPRINDGLFA